MLRSLKRIVPGPPKQQFRERFNRESNAALDPNGILGVLYTPPTFHRDGAWLTWTGKSRMRPPAGYHCRPSEFLMGHADDDAQCLAAGRTSSEFIRSILQREGVMLAPGASILEWGCTAFPHLPFEDNTFTLIYAGSVFTHILQLMDAWVMEFPRILKPSCS